MNEFESSGVDQGTPAVAPAPVIDNTQPATPVAPAPSPENVLPQSKVNELVGRAKAHERERLTREFDQKMQVAMQQQQPYQAPAQQQTPQQAPAQNSFGGMAQLSAQEIEQKIAEATRQEFQRREQEFHGVQQKAQIDQLVKDFEGKIGAATEKFPDLNDRVNSMGLGDMPFLVPLANSVDNTAEVMNFLADDPSKAYILNNMYKENGAVAFKAMQQLSNSLKETAKATSQHQPPNPLRQITPSTTPTDGGPMTIRDLRKDPSLRV
jgi:hypothetical protein